MLIVKTDKGLERFANAIAALGNNAPLALGRALSHTGMKARTQVVRALTKQTGLPRKTIVRAVKVQKPKYGNPKIGRTDAVLSFTLEAKGGDVSLKYFKPRETRQGVSAAPWGKRRLFPSTFMKGGKFPARVALPRLNGHVFKRTAEKRVPIEKQTSGLYIPEELLEDATARAFEDVAQRDLAARVGHELGILLRKNGL